MVACLVFMTSNVKPEFCKGFDPDDGDQFNGLPCVWGEAPIKQTNQSIGIPTFDRTLEPCRSRRGSDPLLPAGASAGCAIAALVFQVLAAGVVWLGMNPDLGATYSFKSGFEPAGASDIDDTVLTSLLYAAAFSRSVSC